MNTKVFRRNRAQSRITRETRWDSFENIETRETYRLILGAFGDREYTTREIAQRVGLEYSQVQPRISELLSLKKIEAVGKVLYVPTGKQVAVYRRA